ncbi:MAG: NAD(P)/FAD-dependent oxidoreductase [Pseudomonadota bacterium]
MSTADAIVIGAGHNGLVCATLLAKAGKTVTLLEANASAGGLAAPRRLQGGFTIPMAHSTPALSQTIIDDLSLTSHGLSIGPALETVGLGEDGQHVHVLGDQVTGATASDAAAYPAFRQRLLRFAKPLRKICEATLPRIGSSSLKDALIYAQGALNLRRLGKEDMEEFLRIATLPMRDLVDEHFEDPKFQALLCWDGLIGSKMAPRSPNHAVLPLLFKMGGVHGGQHCVPQGGAAGLTAALVSAAQAAGVEIRLETPVQNILVAGDDVGERAVGVALADGEELRAPMVVSSADPKTTFFSLVGATHFDVQFTARIKRYRDQGYVARYHAALDALPSIPGLDDLSGRLLIAPTFDAIEFAYDDAKYGDPAQHPVMEITFPSVHDASLAPEGKHILSANVMYAPCDERTGWSAETRARFEKAVTETLERYMPGLADLTTASELITPKDIAEAYHVSGGHWHHGEMALDQMLMMRPTYPAAQYKTQMPGLYLCGAGAHPGGGLTGLPGRNAAREILK